MAKRRRVAVLGGTFDHLHAGHRDLLRAAFASADQVGIGVTTDRYLRAHPKPLRGAITPYSRRRRELVRYLNQHYPRERWWVVPLDDGWGRSVEPGVDLLVVSSDTEAPGRAINQERILRGLNPLRLVSVPLWRGDDLIPVSSRWIRARRIDPLGRRRRPVLLELDPGLQGADRSVVEALRVQWPDLEVRRRRSRAGKPSKRESLPRWDYELVAGTSDPREPRYRLRDRTGAEVDLGPAPPDGARWATRVRHELSERRKAFSESHRFGSEWKRISGSRSTARVRARPRSRTA